MESSRSDHPSQTVSCHDRQPSQTVSCSDRQPSQTVSCSDRQPSQMVSCSDRQPLQDTQVVSCGAPLTSQCTNNEDLARCQQHARYTLYTYTLPPGVSSAGLSERELARGDFYLHPNDRYTKRQQDFLDGDEDVGSEDDWRWVKDDDGGLQSEDSRRSVESQHALGEGPTPPPPPPYRSPPTPRYRGPPAKPIGDPAQNRADTVVPPPPCRPLPSVVPGPPAQPKSEIPDELREPLITLGNLPRFVGRSTDCPPEQMSDLTAPDNGRTVVTPPWDCPRAKWGVLNAYYGSPSADHANQPRCKDARTIENDPHLSGGNPQLSRGSSGATMIPRPAQPPPPLHSERVPLLRPTQPPPPLPPPCYCLQYFATCVPITTHWRRHTKALQHFCKWGRTRGLKWLVLDDWNGYIVPKQPDGFATWSADIPTWCWDSLLAQLTDGALRRIVEGSQGAKGIVACMVQKSSFVDNKKRSRADQTTRTNDVKEMLYHWEFAFLRNNGTVAFLRPSPHSCSIECYEGVPRGESAVATQRYRDITTPAKDNAPLPEFLFSDEGDITCRLDKPSKRCPPRCSWYMLMVSNSWSSETRIMKNAAQPFGRRHGAVTAVWGGIRAIYTLIVHQTC